MRADAGGQEQRLRAGQVELGLDPGRPDHGADRADLPRRQREVQLPDLAEQPFIERYGAELTRRGYALKRAGDGLTTADEIGAVAALEFRRGGLVVAAAEPERRGGGSAGVVYRVR